jgi:hypothetical protein
LCDWPCRQSGSHSPTSSSHAHHCLCSETTSNMPLGNHPESAVTCSIMYLM